MIISKILNNKLFFLFVGTVLSFGPYLGGAGLRLVHLFVYPLFLIAVPVYIFKLSHVGGRFNRSYRFNSIDSLIFVFLLFCFLGFVSAFASPFQRTEFSIIAGFESYFFPVAWLIVLRTFFWFEQPDQSLEALRHVSYVFIFGMAICGIVSFLTIYFDLSFLLQYFYRGDAIEEGWSKIHSMGRYAGLFNSPFEAGLGASLALLLAIYSMGQKKSMGLFFLFIVSLACLAGILSVSKVFLLGGITLAVIQFVSIRQVKLVIYALIISGLFFSFSLQAGFEDDWVGSSYLARLYDFSGQNYNDLESVVNLYSAGRLTKASYTLYWYDFVTETSPIIGHGFGINYSLIIPLDSFFSDVIAFCGFIGIIISLAIFYVFIRPVLLLSSTSIQERVLLVMLNFLALGSSLGANPFTVNSVSMTVFTVWFLLYNKSYHDSHGYQTDLPTKNGHPHQLDYDPERGGQDDPKKNQLVPEILSS